MVDVKAIRDVSLYKEHIQLLRMNNLCSDEDELEPKQQRVDESESCLGKIKRT